MRLLESIGPLLLESICTCLQVTAERRGQDRIAWAQSLRVRFVLPNQGLSEPVVCRGKDISLTGIGFYLPPELPTSHVRIELTSPVQGSTVEVPATIVRVQRYGDSWYEVGARFLLTAAEEVAAQEVLVGSSR
jgi:hypothetical protein